MALTDIANGLTELCRQGQFREAIDRYYSSNIVSIEPVDHPQMPAQQSGIEAIRAKNDWFGQNNEVHSLQIDGPFMGQDQFALRMTIDLTQKFDNKRVKMTEMALYTVKDGKIVKEEFYYHAA
jgi:hypothetical protein